MERGGKSAAADDAGRLKALVREGWTSKSGAWNRWADTLAGFAWRFNEPLIETAGIEAGQAVLDLASGVGEPALTIAGRVGPAGSVTATDLVPEMLAGARRRAEEAGVGNIGFEIADMEALPFADASFDRVTCRFGVMFCPRAEVAFSEARRVLSPGGRAVFLVWGPIGDNTMFDVIQRVTPRFAGTPEYNRALDPFRFGAAGALGAAMKPAGFRHVEETALRSSPTPDAGSRFWRAPVEMSLGKAFEGLTREQRVELDTALDDAFADYLDGDVYSISLHVRMAVGGA